MYLDEVLEACSFVLTHPELFKSQYLIELVQDMEDSKTLTMIRLAREFEACPQKYITHEEDAFVLLVQYPNAMRNYNAL